MPDRRSNMDNEYNVLIQASFDGFCVLDLAGHIMDCNEIYCQMLGYEREELLKLHIGEIEISESAVETQKHFQKIIQTGSDRFQTKHQRKDGTIIDVEISAKFVPDQEERLFAFIRDITERKQAEETLKVEKTFNEAILNSVPGMIYLYDIEGRLVRWNKKHEQMTGYSPEELSHMTLLDWYKGDEKSQKAVTEGVQRTVLTGFGDAEGNLQKKDGGIIPMYFTASLLTIHGKQYFAGFGIDITERKRFEQALRESEERFRSFVENANDIVYTLSPEGVITYASPNWKEILGHDLTEVLGKSYTIFVHPEDLPRTGEVLAHALATGEKINGIEYRVQHKDGTWRWHASNSSIIHDAEGKAAFYLGIGRDITDRKKAEDEIRKLNDELERRVIERTAQLEAANKELEAFSYSVSHDLRAPLRAIDGWSLALYEDYADQLDAQAQTYINRVRSEAQRMGRLIDDVLQLSRLMRFDLQVEKVNLSKMAHMIVNRLRESEPERPVEFVIQEGLSAIGDPRLLDVALFNLLSNAFKFTGRKPEARIEFGQATFQDENIFFVCDNGVGFDMAYATKLFGAFQRMHKPSEFPGTGIGLATVQRIIHRHKGRVWAEAKVDQGATFYFTVGKNHESKKDSPD
jgi:PAS domain S-box-containing protein